jgi:hypothetical protein
VLKARPSFTQEILTKPNGLSAPRLPTTILEDETDKKYEIKEIQDEKFKK